MKCSILTTVALATAARAAVQGFDISNWQTSVDFAAAYAAGARFVIIKVCSSGDNLAPRFVPHTPRHPI